VCTEKGYEGPQGTLNHKWQYRMNQIGVTTYELGSTETYRYICVQGKLIPTLISNKSLPPQDVTPTPMCTTNIHQT